MERPTEPIAGGSFGQDPGRRAWWLVLVPALVCLVTTGATLAIAFFV